MQIKSELRRIFKEKRKRLVDKAHKDELICKRLLSSSLYKNADLILCYASLETEISTDSIIRSAVAEGKRVALPLCIDKNGNMKFYLINSLSDISEGAFGIKEPNAEKCGSVEDFTNSICIVPALSIDRNGYRLGYGKGYYDRFLKNYSSISVGLCYNEFISKDLPIDEFDKAVDYIASEDKIISVKEDKAYV